AKDGAVQNFAAQLWALRGRIEAGDFVVMPLKNSPVLAVGRVTGDYQYLDNADPSLRHVRPVEWIRVDVPRTAVKQDLLYSLGAFLTICELTRNDAAARIASIAAQGRDPGANVSPIARTVSAQTSGGRSLPDSEDLAVTEEAQIDIEQYAFDR